MPDLRHIGLDERQLVWIQAETPAERLWVTEQLVKANAVGLLLSWLPQARQEQIRRLQVCAQACEGPVFLCRPAAAEHEPSAAPLRVQLRFGLDWELHIHLLKRKGPTHEGIITLALGPRWPGIDHHTPASHPERHHRRATGARDATRCGQPCSPTSSPACVNTAFVRPYRTRGHDKGAQAPSSLMAVIFLTIANRLIRRLRL